MTTGNSVKCMVCGQERGPDCSNPQCPQRAQVVTHTHTVQTGCDDADLDTLLQLFAKHPEWSTGFAVE